MDQGSGHIDTRAGTVVGRNQWVQQLEGLDGQGLCGARGLAQGLAFTQQEGGACDHQRGEAQALERLLDLALDAVVEDAGAGVGAHGGHHAAAGGTSRQSRARGGDHRILVHGAKGLLAAGRCNGGAERDVHVVHMRQATQGGLGRQCCKVHGVQVQPWVLDIRRAPTQGRQCMHLRRQRLVAGRCAYVDCAFGC